MEPFFLSKANNQIFDCGGNVLRRTSHANIFEEDGTKKKIEHASDIADCGITADSKFYWVAYEHIVNQRWQARLLIFNHKGNNVFNATSKFDNSVSFKLGSIDYSVYIPSIP